ncbi:MAG: DUF488 domain-containing protein [Prolixibacteraceae bacterium]|jgi:uncharacterized protein (DUF488 family)|nr:DUF488 domain-containing protein [Prolixibacteraceae bacterium]
MLYYRRKILLALLELFNGRLTAKSLQKYLFLFTRAQMVRSFDFIPYRYGCFSFQANQDLSTMQKYGYLEITDQPNGRFIKLKQTENYLAMLDIFDRQALIEVKENFGKLSQQDLIRYTYQKYPFYATKSSIAHELLNVGELALVETQKRSFSEPQLFCIGYEGISLESYINKLIINDVHVLCDVRKNAFSQKYGFSKSQLQKACDGVGIRYVHVPELGIESDKRQELHSQNDYDTLFQDYEKTTLKNNYIALLKVKEMIAKDKRVALTCFEKNPLQCHRTRVANALMQLPDINYTFKAL